MLLPRFTRSPTFADKVANGVLRQVPRAVRVLAVLFPGGVRGRALPGVLSVGPGVSVAVDRGSRVRSVIDLQGEGVMPYSRASSVSRSARTAWQSCRGATTRARTPRACPT